MTTIPERMTAVLLTGHGGLDRLDVRHDVAVPTPTAGEVLIRVAAAGVNNTDVNTRVGWYSKAISSATGEGGSDGFDGADVADAGWAGVPLAFPRVQGADCCGRIVAVGAGVDAARIGERVVVRPMFHPAGDPDPLALWTFGSERDGAFAQYATAPSVETYAVGGELTDVELAALPCAYSTAENLLERGRVRDGDHVLVTGASGGVGTAAVQLARLRGAEVTALADPTKAAALTGLGAARVLGRDADLLDDVGAGSVDVVVDVVGGSNVRRLLELLHPGGRYAVAGAIAGPVAEIDLRTVYLHDLTLVGCTRQERSVFERVVGYAERGELVPLVAKEYPLEEIAAAQRDFLAKRFVGKLVLVVP